MKYNRNRQFGLSIIRYMYTIIPADGLGVYGTSLDGISTYVCDIVVKRFTFAISSPDEFLL